MQAVLYVRQSQDKQKTELAVERQERECRALCERRGWPVAQVIADNDTSASKHGRKGYAELLKLMERRAVDVVVILRVDRLLRLNDELEQLIALSESTGVTVATVEGDVDLTTPQGRLIARILVSVARNEVEVKTARQKLANQQHAALGKPYGSVRPYGYEKGYTAIRESEAEVLREMARRIVSGHSLYDVTYWLNESGIPSPAGKLWQTRSVKRLLTSKTYIAVRKYNEVDYPGTWEPIFDPETFERMQLAIRARAGIHDGKVYGRKYLLTGLVVCGVCGKPLTGTTKWNNRTGRLHRAYYCRKKGYYLPNGGCGSITRGAEALEAYIVSLVMDRLDSPALGKLLSHNSDDGKLGHLLGERDLQKRRLDGLADDYGSGLLTREQLARANQAARAELDRIDSEIAGLTANTKVKLDVGQTLAEAWEQNPSSWRQALLALVIKEIRVLPTRKATGWYVAGDKRYRFNTSSVEVHFADGLVI